MEKKQTAVEWLEEKFNNPNIPTNTFSQVLFNQAKEMENEINQEYYNQGAQDCKNAFEKIISDVIGNINNV